VTRDRATAALRAILAGGPMRATEAGAVMRDAGFTDGQARRARLALGVEVKRVGGGRSPGNAWFEWALPNDGICPTCKRLLPQPSSAGQADDGSSDYYRHWNQ